MAIDARIPLGIQPVQLEGPLDQAQKGMSLRALMTQSRLQEAELADRPAKNALALKRANLDFDNAKLDQIKKANEALGGGAAAVRAAGYDQNAWSQWRQSLVASGAPEHVIAALPEQVDRGVVDGLINRAMTVTDAIKRGNLAELYAEDPPQGQGQTQDVQPSDEPIVRPYTPNPDATPLSTAVRIGDHPDKGGTGPAADDWGVPPQAEMRLPDENAKKPPSIQDDLRAQAAAKRKKADEIRRTFRTEEAFDEAKRLEEEAGRLEDDAWKMREQAKPGNIPAGVIWNSSTNQYTMDGRVLTGAEIQAMDLKGRKASATKVSQTVGMEETPGRKKADEIFAGEFVAWEVAGGYADVVKQLKQLREVSRDLESKNLTGPIIGNTPDAIKQFTNPEAIAARDKVEEVVQRNLRAVLGPQFTEKEGERLIARAFNPKLSEAENKQRVDRLITQIEAAAKAKQEASDYFRKYGTLTGWQGRQYTISDFEDAIEGKVAPLTATNPNTGQKIQSTDGGDTWQPIK